MSDELFRTVGARRGGGHRRLGGVPLSLAIHAVVLTAVLLLTMGSIGPVPILPERLEVILVASMVPDNPLPPTARRAAGRAAATLATGVSVPVSQPTGIGRESFLRAAQPVVGPPAGEDIPVVTGATELPSAIEGTALPPPLPKPLGPIRPGGNIEPPRKLRHVAPVYPLLALSARVEGVVTIDAVIAIDGTVKEARVLASASPLLDDAAIAAVRQWVFSPTTLNGTPVPVILTVRVEFRLR